MSGHFGASTQMYNNALQPLDRKAHEGTVDHGVCNAKLLPILGEESA